MNREIYLTPLNVFYGNTFENMLTNEEAVFNAASDRKVLYKSDTLSEFRMKNVTLEPYLEPCIFGVRPGDSITLEFEARTKEGIGTLDIQYTGIIDNGLANLGNVQGTYRVTIDQTWYKQYKIVVPLNRSIPSQICGIFFNLRSVINNTIIDIRNLKMIVNTKSATFNARTLNYILNSKKAIRKMIKNAETLGGKYEGLSSRVSINGDIIAPINNSSGFRGMAIDINNTKYNTPILVSLEYKVTDANLKIQAVGEENNIIGEATILPASNQWVKTIRKVKVSRNTDKDLIVEIGSDLESDFQIRNIKVIEHCFDDELNNYYK